MGVGEGSRTLARQPTEPSPMTAAIFGRRTLQPRRRAKLAEAVLVEAAMKRRFSAVEPATKPAAWPVSTERYAAAAQARTLCASLSVCLISQLGSAALSAVPPEERAGTELPPVAEQRRPALGRAGPMRQHVEPVTSAKPATTATVLGAFLRTFAA